MQLPDNVKAILTRYHSRYPLPPCVGCPLEQKEQAVRQWTYGFVQQVCYELPGQGWGSKRSSPGAPLTKDKIARAAAGRQLSWDIIVAAGSDAQSLNPNAESEDWTGTGQVFEPVVGVNLLGDGGPVPPVEPPVDPDDRIAQILHRLDGLEAQLQVIIDVLHVKADESQARDGVVQRMLFELASKLEGIRPIEFESVNIGSGRVWGHAHGVTILQPKP